MATYVQYKMRLPSDLHRRLEKIAAKSNRSLNAEMVHRLELSLTTVEPRALAIEPVVENKVSPTMQSSLRDWLSDELDRRGIPPKREIAGGSGDL
jgi:hypothetical protein